MTDGRLWGQPRGIYVLCLVEMWERFSYYGMRALLILYLIERQQWSDVRAALVYGAYTAMVYGFCVLGGWIADRFVGQWRSIAGGAVLILGGHVGLAVQDLATIDPAMAERLLYASLALIVAGTGLFKPSSTTLVGRLYPIDDPNRLTGFHLFYFGINFGAAISALICGALAAMFGWGAGLGAAAIGMAFGLGVLLFGRQSLESVAVAAPPVTLGTVLMPAGMVAAAFALISFPDAVGVVLVFALVIALAVITRFVMRDATLIERRHVGSALLLIAAASIFWSLSEQAGSSLNLFAARIVDLSAGPVRVTAPQLQSLSPAFILVLTPLLALLWHRLGRAGREPGAAWKHVAGLALVGLGFACLNLGIALAVDGQRVALGWLVLSYLLQTLGEVCLAPTAYAAVSRLAPDRIAALMMGLWLFSISIGNFVGARVATLVARPVAGVGGADEVERYATAFGGVATVAIVAALALSAVAPRLQRAMAA